jgi:transglutaminase-like putative cysteine protease
VPVKLRSVVGLGILALWVGVLGLHVRREYFRSEVDVIAAGARALAAGSHFFVVRMNGGAIGTATVRLDTLADGFVLDDDLLLDVPALDTVQRAAARTRVELDRTLALRRFAFRMDSRIGSFGVEGEAVDTMLDVRVEAGGTAQRTRIAGGRRLLLDAAVPVRLAAAGRLEPGAEHTVAVFDPSSMSVREMTVRVTARDTLILPDSARLGAGGRWEASSFDTIPVWQVEQRFGGVSITSWVDEDGLTVRAESPLGFAIERTTFELARQEWADSRGDPQLTAGYGALIEGTAIAANADLSAVEAAPRLVVRLSGVELDGFDLDGGRQRLLGDTLVVTREPDWLWRQAKYALPATDPRLAEFLEATPLIQADDERIRAKAAEITGGTTDPAQAALRLNDWVYRSVRKQITPSVPSAIQVLDALQGDCNEHTVLYVALARSIGLPARPAVGLVHVRGRFYYHAWPEVLLAGAWIAADPTLGQFPADASHLRFLVGGLARQLELIRLIGRLRLDIL